eukprot:2002836-Rhodomonas_salina.1
MKTSLGRSRAGSTSDASPVVDTTTPRAQYQNGTRPKRYQSVPPDTQYRAKRQLVGTGRPRLMVFRESGRRPAQCALRWHRPAPATHSHTLRQLHRFKGERN